jgi:hypothetical protein
MEPEENIDASKKTKETAKKKTVKQTKKDKEFVKNTVEINPELEEQKRGTAVIGWGRMNPITIGHEKLVDKIKSVARSEGGTPLLYLSHSQDKKKNPLTYGDKYTLARRAFGTLVKNSKSKTIMQVLKELESKYDNVVIVVGSDRVKEFDTLVQKYNGKDYNFENLKVVSAGDRDPDADDVSGMSASKMRALASAGKKDEFKKGLPRKLQSTSNEVYDMVRAGMQLAEALEAEGLLVEAPLTFAQRRQRARIMKRYAPKIAAARRRKARRKATLDVLKSRARKKAINLVRKKVAGARGKSYADMTPGEKIMIDKKIQKRQALIDRLAKKLVPQVRKIEAERLKQKNTNEQFEMMLEDYYKGVPRKQHDARKAHFERGAKMDDNNPNAYKPAPGDAGAKTKESKHTKKYRQMYGEQINITNDDKPKKKTFHQMMKTDGSPKLDKRFKINRKDYQSDQTEAVDPRVARLKDQHTDEKNRLRRSHEVEMDRLKTQVLRRKTSRGNTEIKEDADLLKLVDEIHESIQLEEAKQLEGIKKKAEKSGISYGILKKVFDRGVAAWRTGHRPGTTPSQWGYARVNSFITGGKTRTTADADLAKKINEDFENFIEDKASVQHHLGIGLTAKHMKQHALMHIDKDVDGDVDEFDKNTPDEITGAEKTNMTAKMLKKYAGEKEHSKKHIAFESFINEAKAQTPRWKRAGPNGEIEIKFPTGRRFQLEKQLDQNERHKGEWKVMEWDKRRDDWEWHDTYKPKWFAKERVMKMGQYDSKGKKVADYSDTFQSVSEEHGAGFRGTSDLADRYAKDTPGQEPMKTHKNKYKEPKAIKINENFEDLFNEKDE